MDNARCYYDPESELQPNVEATQAFYADLFTNGEVTFRPRQMAGRGPILVLDGGALARVAEGS